MCCNNNNKIVIIINNNNNNQICIWIPKFICITNKIYRMFGYCLPWIVDLEVLLWYFYLFTQIIIIIYEENNSVMCYYYFMYIACLCVGCYLRSTHPFLHALS